MKKLGIISLATLLTLGVTGCGKVSDKEGAKWAEENGYIKYESSDAFTSASKTVLSMFSVPSLPTARKTAFLCSTKRRTVP